MTWQTHAACRGMDTALFFPSERVDRGDTNAARVLYRNARQICFSCPVRTQCLDQALLDGDIDYGLFGGHTPAERKKRLRNQPPHGTLTRYRQGCDCRACYLKFRAYARNRRHA